MMKTISKFILIFLWPMLLLADDPTHFGSEVPFPLGTEVPFPWSMMTGRWLTYDEGDSKYFFDFKVSPELDKGDRMMEIYQYDDFGNLLGKGGGVYDGKIKTVRALMNGVNGEEWMKIVVLRAYYDREGIVAKDKIIPVLTFRDIDIVDPEPDYHFIIRKLDKPGPVPLCFKRN